MPETNFFWDPLTDNILQERDETGAVTGEYSTEPGLYGDLLSQNRGGVENQYHFDALGSTLALTDDNQEVTDTYAYTGFGEPTEHTGSMVNPFQFVGQKSYYTHDSTGERYARQRILSSPIARWLSPDQLLFVDGVNLYGFVHNAPSNFIDADGNATFTLDADSFIPWAWVNIPPQLPPPIVASWVKGDNRGPSDTPPRKWKTKTFAFISIDTCACGIGGRLIVDCGGGNN